MEEKRFEMLRAWGAKSLLATGSGDSAVAVGRGRVLRTLCAQQCGCKGGCLAAGSQLGKHGDTVFVTTGTHVAPRHSAREATEQILKFRLCWKPAGPRRE